MHIIDKSSANLRRHGIYYGMEAIQVRLTFPPPSLGGKVNPEYISRQQSIDRYVPDHKYK